MNKADLFKDFLAICDARDRWKRNVAKKVKALGEVGILDDETNKRFIVIESDIISFTRHKYYTKIDKVRYNEEKGIVEIHIVALDTEEYDKWHNANEFNDGELEQIYPKLDIE